MKREDGSITIFSALAILCIICFLATIVEVTRYRMMQSESLSHVQTAATLSLSQYDPVLWNEYGLMYIRPHDAVDAIVDEGLEHMFYPSNYIGPSQHGFSRLMEPENVSYSVSYNHWLDLDVADETRGQIIRYMTPRIPYLITVPFDDMLNIYDTVQKTSVFIEEKEALLDELAFVEESKKQLMDAIDGVRVQGNSTSYEYGSYIRAFTVQSLDATYMTKEMLENRQKYVIHERVYIDELEQVIEDGSQMARRLYALAKRYERKREAYKDEEDPEIKESLREAMRETKEDIEEQLEDIESLNTSGFVPLQLETQRILSIEEALEDVMACLQNLDESSRQAIGSIQSFRSRLEEGDVMASVKGSLMHDLDSYEREMNTLSRSLDPVNNLALIQEQAMANLGIIRENAPCLIQMRDSLNGFMYRDYQSVMRSSDDGYIDTVAGKLKSIAGKNRHTDNEGAEKPYGYMLSLISTLDRDLSSYTSDLLLDYRYMEESNREDDYDAILEQKESAESGSFISGLSEALSDVFRSGLVLDNENLPSHVMKEVNPANSDFLEDLSVNIYYTHMLSNVSARYNDEWMSMSGYDINRYDMDAQVEYILFGHQEESENIKEVSQRLFALRLLCNTIHIVSDTEKRTLITELATAVAGWWNGGIGTGIFAVIIGAAWASMESMVDVGMLMYGERVPFIKTTSTWYTSLEGNWKDVLIAAIGAARIESERVSGIVDNYLDEHMKIDEEALSLIEETYKESDYEIEYKGDEASLIWESSIEAILRGGEPEVTDNFRAIDHSGKLERILQSYKKEYEEALVSQSKLELEDLVQMKEQWMVASQETVNQSIQQWRKDKKHSFESSLQKLMEDLGEGDQVSQVNTWKKKQVQDNKPKDKDKGNDLSWTAISYSDYLLFFLMTSGESESTKVLRFMDVLQNNLTQAHKNPDLKLMEYGKGVKVNASIDIHSLWMPVGFDSVEVESESNY